MNPSTHSSRSSYIIGLAGGSASGKSTLCAALRSALDAYCPPLTVQVISTDAYFFPSELLPRYRSPSTGLDTPDYNRPDSIDAPRLLCDLQTRAADANRPDVLIVEGLMVLYHEDLRGMCDLKLFLDLEGEVRALRRMVRNIGKTIDPSVRQDPQSVANYYLESAYLGYTRFVEPSRKFADLILRGDGDFSRTAPMIAAVVHEQISEL